MNQSWQRQKEAARNNPVMQMNATDRALERLERAIRELDKRKGENNEIS